MLRYSCIICICLVFKLNRINTAIEINKLTIDAVKAITLTCFKFNIELLLYDVEIRNIPIKGTINKSVSNMCRLYCINEYSSVSKFIPKQVKVFRIDAL